MSATSFVEVSNFSVEGQGKNNYVGILRFYDYCFIGKDDEKVIPVLVVKDEQSKAMKGYFCDHKGSGDGSIVKKVVRLIDECWGRNQIVLKADKEPAIKGVERQDMGSKNSRDCDGTGTQRRLKEQWNDRESGAGLRRINEDVVKRT